MIWIRAAIWTRAELIFTSIGLQTPARPLMKYRVTRYCTFKWESVHGTRNYGCKQYNGTILEATVNASSRIDVTTSSLPLFYSVITGQNKVRSGPSETWENAFYLSRSEKKIQKVFSFLIKQDKTTSLYFTVCCATKKDPAMTTSQQNQKKKQRFYSQFTLRLVFVWWISNSIKATFTFRTQDKPGISMRTSSDTWRTIRRDLKTLKFICIYFMDMSVSGYQNTDSFYNKCFFFPRKRLFSATKNRI